MDKLSRTEVILTLSLIAPVILVFIEHNEGFMLFLLEMGFLGIVALMYTGLVLIALIVTEFIEKLLWRIKHGKESGD